MKHKRKNVKLFFIKIKNSSCLKLTVRKMQGKASGQDDFFIKHGQNYNKYMQLNKKNAGTQLKMDKNEQKLHKVRYINRQEAKCKLFNFNSWQRFAN